KWWYSGQVSVDSLIAEVQIYLNKFCQNIIDKIGHNYPYYFHVFTISESKLLKKELSELTVETTKKVWIECLDIEPIVDEKDGLTLIISAINDEKLICDTGVDFDPIQKELDWFLGEQEPKLSPLLKAINYSLGEMLYRHRSDQLPEIENPRRVMDRMAAISQATYYLVQGYRGW
ncbi:MAG: hypothetical protein F6K21_19585, partial [Symploca sp. SIO2D2]|nr:hypothetical protein [Symploca sp. SIO2D2]